MSYHTTGSIRRYSGGYGTIDVFLENSSNLNIKESYDYVVQTPGGPYKGFAMADDVGGEIVLVDNTFTLPDSSPPYEMGYQITVINSQSGEIATTTTIKKIQNHGQKSVFKYDLTSDEQVVEDKQIKIEEEFVIQNEVVEEEPEDRTQLTEIQPGVYTKFADENFYYADGETIQRPPLPPAYQLPNNQNKCLNCSFFIEAASYCSKWKADVRENYWCAAWKGIEIENNESMDMVSDSGNNITTQYYPKFTENNIADDSVEDTVTYQNNIVDTTINADDIPLPDSPPMGGNMTTDSPPIEPPIGDDLESETFYVSPEIEDVGGQIDFYPTGSDGLPIIPDEKTIKRMIREQIYEGMYSAILNDELLSVDDILSFQQTIRDGALTVGRNDDEILVYTKKDGNVLNQPGEDLERIVGRVYADFESAFSSIESESQLLNIITANAKNYLQYTKNDSPKNQIVYRVIYTSTPQISEIYAVKEGGQWTNVPNIPNINFSNEFGKTIDIGKAQENLDTNIFELLPFQRSRQNEVDELFTKLTASDFLGEVPQFGDGGSITEQELTNDRELRISFDDNPNAAITRLDSQTNTPNQNKSLQSLRNTLNLYLKDVDNVVDEIDDTRPEYQNISEGFLKLRKPNQAIIIRNPDGGEMDFQKNDSYLTDGFTITMWVRFVGRTGHGTLFSYGNPYKEDVQSRYGFRLETFTVSKEDRYPLYPTQYRVQATDSFGSLLFEDDGITPKYRYNSSYYITKPNEDSEFEPLDEPINGFVDVRQANGNWLSPEPFKYSDYERFVRLVVWDHTDTIPYESGDLSEDDGTYGKLYDSHFVTDRKTRQKLYDPKASSQGTVRGEGRSGRKSALPVYFPSSEYGNQGQGNSLIEFAFNYTRVPTGNLDEWFFICATYDPEVNREEEDRAKVEIISKRDLLTARGFKVEEPQSEEEPTTEPPLDTTDSVEIENEEIVDEPEQILETEVTPKDSVVDLPSNDSEIR